MSKRILTSSLLFIAVAAMSTPWANTQTSTQDSDGVPAYNKQPPAKTAKLPAILLKEELWGENGQSPFQTHAYELAAKIPSVIHQMPCYCHCDRMGHKSLRSCFEGTHGAQCDICMKELYYIYGENKKGKTVAQIRKGIIAGEWKAITPEIAAALN